MSKGTIATLVFLGVLGYVSWTLILTGSNYECEVCVRYKGNDSCQIVQGVIEEETIMQGVSTACGGVANGMTENIECQATRPTKKSCKKIS